MDSDFPIREQEQLPSLHVDMDNNPVTWNSADHDLLIEVNTTLKYVREEIGQLTQSISDNGLDHETRIRSLERQRWMIVGASSIVAALIGWISNIVGSGGHL